MSRAAAVIGFIYGLVSLGGGVQGYLGAQSTASLIAGAGAGLVLILSAVQSLRGRRGFQVALCVVALVLMARFLPAYFRSPNLWPALVMIALGTVTLGLGVLGLLLDSYRPGPSEGRPDRL